jgi:hypothetical protein
MCAVKYSAMAIHLVEKMNQIDFETLGISNYNKEYIAKMKPMFSYFFNINAACLKQGIEALKLSPMNKHDRLWRRERFSEHACQRNRN